MGCGSSNAEPEDNASKPSLAKPPAKPPVELTEIGLLGEGASCKVLEVKGPDGHRYAHKQLVKEGGLGDSIEENREMFLNEAFILGKLNNPNIIKLHWHWEDTAHFNLVTDMCTGGELFDKIVNMDHFSEKKAAVFARSMLGALQACHEENVVHRDLKPENFVLLDTSANSGIVLIDFGCAIKMDNLDGIIDDLAGTPYYLAPEVLSDNVCTLRTWMASDVWSLGVIIYVMVVGSPPFKGANIKKIFSSIKKDNVRFPPDCKLSDQCKDLIVTILNKNPEKRPTIHDILKHPWLNTDDDDIHLAHVLGALEGFQQTNGLKRAVANMLADDLSKPDHDRLEELFKKFDKGGEGRLGAKDIANMMRSLGHSPEHAQEVLQEADKNGDGKVDLDEFVHAEVLGEIGDDDARIRTAFNKINKNGNGHLTVDDIVGALHIDEEVVKMMISEVDSNHDNLVDFHEFKAAMANHLPHAKKHIRSLAEKQHRRR